MFVYIIQTPRRIPGFELVEVTDKQVYLGRPAMKLTTWLAALAYVSNVGAIIGPVVEAHGNGLEVSRIHI